MQLKSNTDEPEGNCDGVSDPGDEAGECRSHSGVTGRNAGGVNTVVPVIHPRNGGVTQLNQSSDDLGRCTAGDASMTRHPCCVFRLSVVYAPFPLCSRLPILSFC